MAVTRLPSTASGAELNDDACEGAKDLRVSAMDVDAETDTEMKVKDAWMKGDDGMISFSSAIQSRWETLLKLDTIKVCIYKAGSFIPFSIVKSSSNPRGDIKEKEKIFKNNDSNTFEYRLKEQQPGETRPDETRLAQPSRAPHPPSLPGFFQMPHSSVDGWRLYQPFRAIGYVTTGDVLRADEHRRLLPHLRCKCLMPFACDITSPS